MPLSAAKFVDKRYMKKIGFETLPRHVLWVQGDIEIAVENLSKATNGCDRLLMAHWNEIANYKGQIPLEPRWDDIYQLERDGRIVLLTLREKGALIGYSMFVLNIHLHYKSLTVATNDILYVSPEKRRGRLGIRLIRESEKYLQSIGANKITWHMKPNHDFAKLLEADNYLFEEKIYGKVF